MKAQSIAKMIMYAQSIAKMIMYAACLYLLYIWFMTGEIFFAAMAFYGLLMMRWDGWSLNIDRLKRS